MDDVLNRAVNGLLELDLGPDRRMAVFAENAVETGLANLAGLLAGISVVPVNFHLTGEEAGYVIDNCEAKAVIYDAELGTGVDAVSHDTQISAR